MRSGFTLIQLSILLTIASLVLVATLPSTRSTLNGSSVTTTKMNAILTAMRQYETANAALPCPADANLAISNPSYGVAASYTGTSSNCTGATAPKANYVDATNHVAIGMVPVKTLGLPSSYAADAFGNDITYAVDTNATVCFPGTLPGQITITDNNGMATTVGALVSHGPDGHGAWIPLPGTGSGAARLNANSSDTDEHLVNAHGLSGGGFPSNYSAINSMVTSAENTSTTFVRKPPTPTFDDIVVYKSNLWTLNTQPAASSPLFPTLTSIPATGTYSTGQTLSFLINFSQGVVVTGTPRLDITLPSGTVYANYNPASPNTTATQLDFDYQVGISDSAPSGMTALISPIDLNGGTIYVNGLAACPYFTTQSVSGIVINPLVLAVSFYHTTAANSYLKTYAPTSATSFAATSTVNTSISLSTTSDTDSTFSIGGPDGGLVAAFSPDNKYLAFGDASAAGPYLQMYQANSSGIYTLMSSPFNTTFSKDVSDIRWSYGDNYLAVVGTRSPPTPKSAIMLYSNNGGTFTQVSSVVDTSGNNGMTAAFTHDINSSYLAYAPYTSPFTVTVWQNNSGTFSKLSGSKVSALSSISGTPWDLHFSPDDTNLAVTSSAALTMFSFNSSTGTFALLPTQPTQPSSPPNIVAWSPNGQLLAASADSYPYIYIYQRSGTGSSATFTLLTSLSDAGAAVNSVAWSADGQYLAAGSANPNGTSLYIYRWNGSTFTLLSTPTSGQQPGGQVWRMDFMHAGVNDN